MTVLKVIGNTLTFRGRHFTCAVGKGGFSSDKREGDGCSPVGMFFLRECWYRPDRVASPLTSLPVRAIQENDGWCDDPESPDYNMPIRHPYGYSHERLWRDDHVYDLIVPIGYNDDPVVAGRGSAIFLHIARAGYEPTEGCIALNLADLQSLLPHLSQSTRIEIAAA